MKVTPEWIKVILSKNNRWRSIAKVVGFQIMPAAAKGENYSSDMSRLLVDVLLDSGQRDSISIIVKSMPSTELRRAKLTEMGVFVREIYVYRDIIPNMEKLLEEAGDKSETIWCKCMECTPYKTLFLEDLSEQGYKLVDRLKGLDFEHSKLTVLALAKFHAISVALQERGLIPMNIFGRGVYDKKEDADQFQEHMLINFIEHSNKSWDDEWKPIVAKIEHKMLGKLTRLLDESTWMDESTFRVLCHSDCWHNNLLFKYDKEGSKPVFVKMVDYQHTTYQMPARDLQYFLNTSTSLTVRESHHEELILLYYKELIQKMAFFKCKREAPSEKQFLRDVHRLDFYGLTTTITALPLMVVEKPEVVPDMEEFLKTSEENKFFDMAWAFKSSAYQEIMKVVIRKAIDKGLI